MGLIYSQFSVILHIDVFLLLFFSEAMLKLAAQLWETLTPLTLSPLLSWKLKTKAFSVTIIKSQSQVTFPVRPNDPLIGGWLPPSVTCLCRGHRSSQSTMKCGAGNVATRSEILLWRNGLPLLDVRLCCCGNGWLNFPSGPKSVVEFSGPVCTIWTT